MEIQTAVRFLIAYLIIKTNPDVFFDVYYEATFNYNALICVLTLHFSIQWLTVPIAHNFTEHVRSFSTHETSTPNHFALNNTIRRFITKKKKFTRLKAWIKHTHTQTKKKKKENPHKLANSKNDFLALKRAVWIWRNYGNFSLQSRTESCLVVSKHRQHPLLSQSSA